MIIEINGIDRTDQIEFGSILRTDCINDQTDSLDFNIVYYSGKPFRPVIDSEVIMYEGGKKVFRGKITKITARSIENGTVVYNVSCTDISCELNNILITEEYTDTTIENIIKDIFDRNCPSFTYNHLDCPIILNKKIFDHISIFEAVSSLAEITGYAWYIDSDRDLHFFGKATELAPFDITDEDGHVIAGSLEVSNDLSQMRNIVYVKGGEVEGESRTETFDGDGVKLQFKLANKFARLPTVTIEGVAKTCGVDFLDNEADYDCFWDYNQKYVRFKTAPPIGTNNISISGIPLYNLIVQVCDTKSIAQYGVHEFLKIDNSIRDRATALSMAKTEIEAYRNGLIEGVFETYDAGLRSGQVITINSDIMGINEQFMIQKVTYRMLSPTLGTYTIELATLRAMKVIEFLIYLLNREKKIMTTEGEQVLEKTSFPNEQIKIIDTVSIVAGTELDMQDIKMTDTVMTSNIQPEWVLGEQLPSGVKRIFCLDGSYLG